MAKLEDIADLLPGWDVRFKPRGNGAFLGEATSPRGSISVLSQGTTLTEAREDLLVTAAREIVLPAQLGAMGWIVEPCLDEFCLHDLVVAREATRQVLSSDPEDLWAIRVSASDTDPWAAYSAMRSHLSDAPRILATIHALTVTPFEVTHRRHLADAITRARTLEPFSVDVDVDREVEAEEERQFKEERAFAIARGVPEDVVDEVLLKAVLDGQDSWDPVGEWLHARLVRQAARSSRLLEGVPEELVDEVVDHELSVGSDPYD